MHLDASPEPEGRRPRLTPPIADARRAVRTALAEAAALPEPDPHDDQHTDDARNTDDARTDAPRSADDLEEAVSGLGETDEDRLDTVAERNDSLKERLPGDENLPRTKGAPGQG